MTIRDIDLDHVAVACEQQTSAWPLYAGELGGQWIGGGVTAGFASAQVRYANGMKVEVLEPYEPERNDFLRRFLDRNGPGPHHLTYKVKDIVAALDEAEAAGFRPVGVDLSDPHWKEAFLHPKDAPGVVIQLAQASGSDWGSERPAELPAPRPAGPATLVHVAHAVAEMAAGLALFHDLLAGTPAGKGEVEGVPFVDLTWSGGGRVRVLHADPSGPLAEWVGGRAGRVHHIAFTGIDPASVHGAVPTPDGGHEVPPEANLGVRLLLV